jgi:hypothetical protein
VGLLISGEIVGFRYDEMVGRIVGRNSLIWHKVKSSF